ncbi:MAG: hypothetical protein DYG98_22540 [Haliscomenobacteraceae bacterium CHB4]|nr:hypothetical protein [Haliscomenobacteraceae bacterium CHB4]
MVGKEWYSFYICRPISETVSCVDYRLSAIRNPQSAIRNPQSAIRNPQSQIRNFFTFKTNQLWQS